MAKTREIQCIHYICEGNCDLGKEGTFRHQCQTCKTYKKKPGGKPARTDTDVRNWIGSRERNGTRLWKATENRTNTNERGWLLWLPSFCLQDTYTYLRIRTRILGYSV